jgi:hypothetical protein
MGLRRQPREEKFFTRFSKAGSNVVRSAAIRMEFAAAPHERWAENAKRLHDTEHAGEDQMRVGPPAASTARSEPTPPRSVLLNAHRPNSRDHQHRL